LNNRWTILGALVVLAVIVVACVVATLKIDLTPKPEKGKAPVRVRNFGEGIRLTQHGLYGIDLVSIGKAHMRKLRKGPFTIGAINELVLEDVSLALPEDVWNRTAPAPGAEDGGSAREARAVREDSGPRAMLSKLGINAGNLKMGGNIPRFSALAILNLRVARIEGTNAVPWFAAVRGEAGRGGLKLESGWSVDGGRTNRWSEALLVVDPELRIVPAS